MDENYAILLYTFDQNWMEKIFDFDEIRTHAWQSSTFESSALATTSRCIYTSRFFLRESNVLRNV